MGLWIGKKIVRSSERERNTNFDGVCARGVDTGGGFYIKQKVWSANAASGRCNLREWVGPVVLTFAPEQVLFPEVESALRC